MGKTTYQMVDTVKRVMADTTTDDAGVAFELFLVNLKNRIAFGTTSSQ